MLAPTEETRNVGHEARDAARYVAYDLDALVRVGFGFGLQYGPGCWSVVEDARHRVGVIGQLEAR
jgi:hypothetical protein